MEILDVKNLNFGYPGSDGPVLKNVSFSVEKGDFAVMCGATGCGKTTLLKLIKPELTPKGEADGTVLFLGQNVKELSRRDSAHLIGYVMQKPEEQIVTDTVRHEIAFGLENLGLPRNTVAKRIAETASFFGIGDLFEKKVSALSGGQKQLLSLASVCAMRPELLILDEPTSRLDPISASSFISVIKRLNRELGITVLIAEHRTEDLIPTASRLIVMENGTISHAGRPDDVLGKITSEKVLASMPVSVRLAKKLGHEGKMPKDIPEGRHFLEENYAKSSVRLQREPTSHGDKKALEFKNVFFRFEKGSKDVLSGVNMTVFEGEIFCILGANGSGKTTLLKAASGLLKPFSGKVEVFEKPLKKNPGNSLYDGTLALLPQDVQTVFLKSTVREDIGVDTEPSIFPRVEPLLEKHPYDLSGGEMQLAALAKVLKSRPRLILADEPTKGLDSVAKSHLAALFKELKAKGITVLTVTHDAEFAAMCADKCALMFGGSLLPSEDAFDFFSGNTFYTTAVSRMTSGFFENAVTVDDAVMLCRESEKKRGTP